MTQETENWLPKIMRTIICWVGIMVCRSNVSIQRQLSLNISWKINNIKAWFTVKLYYTTWPSYYLKGDGSFQNKLCREDEKHSFINGGMILNRVGYNMTPINVWSILVALYLLFLLNLLVRTHCHTRTKQIPFQHGLDVESKSKLLNMVIKNFLFFCG